MPAVAPVTIPPETVACALLTLHAPPATPSDNVIDELTQTLEAPDIVPAFGKGLTVIVFLAIAVPQLPETVYMIVSMPAVTPVAIPPEIVACALLALQAPPVATSVNVIDEPTHTPEGPVMLPAFGNALTVTVFVAVAVPHPLVTV
jgi:hypothetical protein